MIPIASMQGYESLIYSLPNLYPQIQYSTLVLKRYGRHAGEVSGTVFLEKEIKLNVKELIDFRKKRIRTYSYETYLGRNKQYCYDDQPHPSILSCNPPSRITNISIPTLNSIAFQRLIFILSRATFLFSFKRLSRIS
ncbi:MAG: hypothetical protein ACREOO_14880 [bacterium]